MGSTIDFVLGSGIGDEEFPVPELVGMTVAEVRALLAENHIGIGAIVIQGGISDTASAYVVKQNPEKFTEPIEGQKFLNRIRSGQLMDIWISKDAPVLDSTATDNTPN